MDKDKKPNKALGNRVREVRKEAGLTQKQLADLLFYTNDKTIAAIENGRRNITRQMADKMAALFKIDANYLLDENIKYKSSVDQFNAVLNQSAYENDLIIKAVVSLAMLNGYEVEINWLGGEGKQSVDVAFKKLREFLVLSMNGEKQISLSLDKVNTIGNNLLSDFSSYLKLLKLEKH